MSSGPVEQLSPITSTSSEVSVVSTAWMSVPSSILPPFGSSDTLVWIGTALPVSLNASRAPKTAALTSRMSCAVSMMIRSAPPSTRPCACSVKTSTSYGKGDPSERRVVGGGQVPGRPDRARDEAALARRRARDLGGLAVDLERVLVEPPLLELEAAALEGVGLDHVGAGGQHRLVDALDHVRPLQDERLVALARQAAVVLGGQVELLERGAHAAVEDDDSACDGIDVVALGQGPSMVPTLTRMCEGFAGRQAQRGGSSVRLRAARLPPALTCTRSDRRPFRRSTASSARDSLTRSVIRPLDGLRKLLAATVSRPRFPPARRTRARVRMSALPRRPGSHAERVGEAAAAPQADRAGRSAQVEHASRRALG